MAWHLNSRSANTEDSLETVRLFSSNPRLFSPPLLSSPLLSLSPPPTPASINDPKSYQVESFILFQPPEATPSNIIIGLPLPFPILAIACILLFLPFLPLSSLTERRHGAIESEMKVQCDVCAVEAASVFCCADEAALCDACDRRIHSANKLAGKHRRLSLLHPSPSSSSPLCDICQERRGFLFCQEDRAILCRDCDIPIHTTNNLTMNHHRFLLTGVRLSSAPIPSAPPSEAEVVDKKTNGDDAKIKNNCYESNKNVVAAEEEAACSSSTTAAAAAVGSNSSSISEYLIKMLPG